MIEVTLIAKYKRCGEKFPYKHLSYTSKSDYGFIDLQDQLLATRNVLHRCTSDTSVGIAEIIGEDIFPILKED